MKSFETQLAEVIDSLALDERISVSEGAGRVLVRHLTFEQAKKVLALLSLEDWAFSVEDSTEQVVSKDNIDPSYSPFFAEITLPTDRSDRVLTSAGLKDRLRFWNRHETGVIRLPDISAAIDTFSLRLAPWNDDDDFVPSILEANPRQFVQEVGNSRSVVNDLGPWLLRDGVELTALTSPRTRIWAEMSMRALLSSVADEVSDNGSFCFRGPPAVRFERFSDVSQLHIQAFNGLQRLVNWVYVSHSQAESRRVLVVGEILRSSYTSQNPMQIAEVSPSILEGARIANQISLQKVSLDAVKALAELRRAVSDEAARLSETTRNLANSVAGALFTGIGVMAARLSVKSTDRALDVAVTGVAVVSFLFVGAVVLSGWRFLSIQRGLRKEWRERLYRYLSGQEYQRLVVEPAAQAESTFVVAAWVAIGCALLNSAALVFSAYPELFDAIIKWLVAN